MEDIHLGIDFDDTMVNNHDDDTWSFIDGMVETLESLSSRGYIFHIITAREPVEYNLDYVGSMLEVLDTDYNLHMEDVTYTSGKSKGVNAATLSCSYMIDDNAGYLIDCLSNKVVPVHFVHPTGVQKPSLPGYVIARSWEEIDRILP
jgi:hypothetical protein